ncbi:MAG TPA: sulfite exporter TauE/SafE family protein [Thermoanaerobaculia bacterium]|nr:sulfite exporter TauE/SafE family protein [Thermoanaerobaculia bacterium]
MQILGLFLAGFIGLSLGLLGGGGSILAVPILVYAAGMAAKPAIAVSLLVVGATSLIGALQHWRAGFVDVRMAVVFGLVSMAGSYAGGRLAALLSDRVQLTFFAAVMLAASISMFRKENRDGQGRIARLPLIAASAAAVGLLTGVVGVGGGFLIVPALVLFAGQPMRRAVGTSLLVIAMNSAAGFAAYAGRVPIDWTYTAAFTVFAVAGVLIGSAAAQFVSHAQLKKGFALLLVVVASFVFIESALTERAAAAGLQGPHADDRGLQ